MEKRFDIPRTMRRMAPKHAATAAVFRDGEQLAYGVITNVSAMGVCVVTDRRIAPGSDVSLKLSFYEAAELIEISARVVWNRRGGVRERGFEGLQLHGLQFTHSSAVLKAHLHGLLSSNDFIDVYRPSSTEFDSLQESLAHELEQLGAKIHETTGDES